MEIIFNHQIWEYLIKCHQVGQQFDTSRYGYMALSIRGLERWFKKLNEFIRNHVH